MSGNGYKGEALDRALARFHAQAEPGRKYTLQAIAEACGCSRQNIEQIEKKALRNALQICETMGIGREEIQ